MALRVIPRTAASFEAGCSTFGGASRPSIAPSSRGRRWAFPSIPPIIQRLASAVSFWGSTSFFDGVRALLSSGPSIQCNDSTARWTRCGRYCCPLGQSTSRLPDTSRTRSIAPPPLPKPREPHKRGCSARRDRRPGRCLPGHHQRGGAGGPERGGAQSPLRIRGSGTPGSSTSRNRTCALVARDPTP